VRENALKEDLGEGRGGGERVAVDPERLLGRGDGPPGLRLLTIDMQHGVVDYQVRVSMLQGISTLGVVPLARVPWNDPARLMKDPRRGRLRVICP